MSEDKKDATAPKGSKLPLILILVNTLIILGAMGMLVYTRILFKRPSITEASERKKLAQVTTSPTPSETGMVGFDPVTINIAQGPDGRNRYATIGFSLEIRDSTRQQDVESVRALIMDKFLQMVGRKQYQELNNVQGRYVLRTELVDTVNQIIFKDAGRIEADPATAPQPAAQNAEGGGEGGGEGKAKAEGKGEEGEGGEGKSAKAAAPASPKPPIRDLVTDVFFTQFVVQ